MPTIAKALKMNAYQKYVSNIVSVLATIFARFICGPLSARYGARTIMVWCLILASIPTFLIGTVTSFEGLCVVRFFIGIIGSSFVMSQYWMNAMFSKNVVGSANAIVGGWGNLGGGITQVEPSSHILKTNLFSSHFPLTPIQSSDVYGWCHFSFVSTVW